MLMTMVATIVMVVMMIVMMAMVARARAGASVWRLVVMVAGRWPGCRGGRAVAMSCGGLGLAVS